MISRRKKRINKIKRIIVICILLLVSVLFLSNKTNITKIERIFKSIGIASIDLFSYPIDIVEQKLIDSRKEKQIEKKNKELEKTIIEYKKMEIEYNELKKTVTELEKAIDLKIIKNRKSIIARVVNRNVGAWYNELTINKGEKDGVKVGDAVVINSGLVGNVIQITDYYSTVKLITSRTTENISVKIENSENEAYGILKSYSKDLFVIEVLDGTDKLEIGATITTTGLTTNYPIGIKVGHVEKIELDNFGLSHIVKARSNVNFNRLNYVEVIIGEEQ